MTLNLATHANKLIPLGGTEPFPERAHVFEVEDLDAIEFALVANRPLLVRGEPGTGKTQLAEAAAKILARPLLPYAVDGRTEPRDLLFEVDFVQRLAEAQLEGALRSEDTEALRARLGLLRFTRPGPLWWGLAWDDARNTTNASPPDTVHLPGWKPGDGCVVLIDEIDKAESDVPNGLLEVLGSGRFRGPTGVPVRAAGKPPLIVITTNEERELPDAFVRRCLVRTLHVPSEKSAFVDAARRRGEAHFGKHCSSEVLEGVAARLFEHRSASGDGPKPGFAEYLDALRVLAKYERSEQLALLERLRSFVFQKSTGAR